MMSNKNKLYWVIIPVLAFLALVGCQPSSTSPGQSHDVGEASSAASTSREKSEGQDDKTNDSSPESIVYGLNTAPDGKFHPFFSDSIYDTGIGETIYASLLRLDENLELEPALAESFEVSEDQSVITFKLQEGLKWSDGEPLTSEDIAFTLSSLADQNYDGPFVGYVEQVKGYEDFKNGEADALEGLQMIDEQTLEITFEEPYAPALTNIGLLGLIPKHIWQDIDLSEWQDYFDAEHLIGAGQYKLEEHQPGQFVRLTANDHYFAGQPETSELIFKVINEDTLMADLEAGQVNIVDVSNMRQEDKDQLVDAGFTIHEHENSMIQVMGMNNASEKLADPILHQAITQAVDRQSLIDTLLEGNGKVVNTLILESSWAYPGEDVLEAYPYDVEAALQLLEENGYHYQDEILSKNGEAITLELIVPTGDEAREQMAQVIQSHLKDIGIDVQLQPMEFSAMMDIIFADDKNYEAFLMGSNQPVDPDISAYWSTDGAWNMTAYSNEDMDQALEAGIKHLEIEDRQQAYTQVGQLLNRDLPFITMYSQNVQIAQSENVSGFNPSLFRDFADSHLWKIQP